MHFWPEFLLNFIWVLLFGGAIILSSRLYWWYLDRYRETKTQTWKRGLEWIVLQIYPPEENQRSMAEMEALFSDLFSIYEEKAPKDVYIKGKWYEGFSLEIHSDGGDVNFYIRTNRWYEELVRNSFESHYPGTKLIEVSDPIGKWPRQWTKKNKPFKDMFGANMKYEEIDAIPISDWNAFQDGNNPPENDPIYQLISFMSHIKKEEYAIFKITIRPFDDQAKKKQIRESAKELRKQYAEKSVSKLGSSDDSKSSNNFLLLTNEERDTLYAMIKKAGSHLAKTKIRFAFFSNQTKAGAYESHINGYFRQFSSFKQGVACSETTRTNQDEHGGKNVDSGYNFPLLRNPVISGFLAKAIDHFYWYRERYYRKQQLYRGLVGNENVDIGETVDFYSPAELAAIFHLPTTYSEDPARTEIIKSIHGDEDSFELQGLPPSNLPT
jgi:hypothetical protein